MTHPILNLGALVGLEVNVVCIRASTLLEGTVVTKTHVDFNTRFVVTTWSLVVRMAMIVGMCTQTIVTGGESKQAEYAFRFGCTSGTALSFAAT